ncbi:hypothetical protein SB659_14030 [Arthrobacter sp. SIMBA_036]
MHLLANLRHRQDAVSGNVDEATLLGFDFLQLIGVPRIHLLDILLLTEEGLFQSPAHILLEVLVENEPAVRVGHTVLDQISREIGKVALALLTSSAKEVFVRGASSPLHLCVDDAALLAALEALAAVEHALEEVVVDTVTRACTTSGAQNILHLIEQVLANDWFMPSGISIALIDDVPDVIRVLQHLVQLAGRDGAFGESCGLAIS